jgi:Lrp/AsnC family transcriptional regulator, leucine-responsive regulatory protein
MSVDLLDTFGRKLLEELQENARIPFAELARRIGLSPTATIERVRQMQELGIIGGYSVEIDREALGLPVLAFVRLTCEGDRYTKFLNFVKTLEEVRECHHLTGADAFLLKVTTTSIPDLEALVEALLPYGSPTTSLVYSSPVVRKSYAVTSKLTTISAKPPAPYRKLR